MMIIVSDCRLNECSVLILWSRHFFYARKVTDERAKKGVFAKNRHFRAGPKIEAQSQVEFFDHTGTVDFVHEVHRVRRPREPLEVLSPPG